MWSWHVAVPFIGPCATPLIIMPHEPQIPSRQSWSKAIGCSPLPVKRFVDDVEHLEERHVRADVVGLVALHRARRVGTGLSPHEESHVHGKTRASYLYERCERCTFSNTSGSLRSTGGFPSPA